MLSKTFAKYIQSLHHKKFRDSENAFIAEADKTVMELLHSQKFNCLHIAATADWLQSNETALKKLYDGPLHSIQDFELEKISALSTPNQVLAVFDKPRQTAIVNTQKLILALDDIRDPGNMGTIIRIADWFGIDSMLCSVQCADIYNPKVVQSTMGSLGRVNVLYTDLAECIKTNQPSEIYAAALNGKNINSFQPVKNGVIIIGNEARGISNELMQLATEKITIPRKGNAESLNAAVATGILLSYLA